MPSPYGPPPTSIEMFVGAVIFTAFATTLSMLLWAGVRRLRNRPPHWRYALIGMLIVCASVGVIDVSMKGNSGIFSIFALIVIPVYIGAILLVVLIAGLLVR